MNDLERDKIKVLLSDPHLLSGLRKVFVEVFEENLPVIQSEDDTVVGQKYRAYETSKRFVAQAFQKLEAYRTVYLSPDDMPSHE